MSVRLCTLAVVFFGLSGLPLFAQNVTTISDGNWTNPSIWSNGVIPTTSNTQSITINHAVTIPAGSSLNVRHVTISSGKSLIINSGATVTMDSPTGGSNSITVNGTLSVGGTLVGSNGSKMSSSAANTTITGTYEHRYTTTQGSIPLATWSAGSNLIISGYTNSTIGITASGNYGQSFYNVTYNCASQTGVVTLNGQLTSVANNFNVTSTGTGTLALVSDQNSNQNNKIISIGNNLNISGTSELMMTRGATGTLVNVGADCNVTLASDAVCRFSATTGAGSYTLNVGGSFNFNSPGAKLTLVSDNNSLGIIKVNGNVNLISGVINEAGGGQVARGEIHFVGSGVQSFVNSGGSTNNTQIDYFVYGTSILDLTGENALKGNNKSSLTVYSPGKVRVHSTNSSGAIITTGPGAGNIQIGGAMNFESGSTLVYKGTTPQVVGNGHPRSSGMIFEVDNSAGVTFGDNSNNGNNGNILEINGTLLLTNGNFNLSANSKDRILQINGIVQALGNKITATGAMADIVLNGSGAFGTFPFPSGTISFRNLTVNRSAGSVTFNNAINLSGAFTASQGTTTFNQPLNVTGDVLLNNAAVVQSLSTLTTAGNLNIASTSAMMLPYSTVTIGKDLTTNGTFSVGSNTVIFNGTTKQNINGTTPTTFFNVQVTNVSDTVRVASNHAQAGALTLAENTTFDADGTVAVPASYTLLSLGDNPTQDASVASLPATAKIVGNVVVQRYMSPENRIYRYLSAPTSNARVIDLQNAQIPVTGTFPGASTGCTGCLTNPSMYDYDGATSTYNAYPTSSGSNLSPLTPTRGYAVFVRQNLVGNVPIVINYTGPVNRDNKTFELGFNNADPSGSWNLVGNPYPSAIQWRESGWNRNDMDEWISVRDNGTGMHHYCTFSGVGYDDLLNGVIATGQAFWVRPLSASGSLEITEQAKSTDEGAFYRDGGKTTDVLSIAMKRGNLKDFTYLQLKQGGESGLDRFDAVKMYNDNYNFTTLMQDHQLAVNVLDKIECGTELALDFTFVKTGSGNYVINPFTNYSFVFRTYGKFSAYTIHLKDKFTGSTSVVEDGSVVDFSITNNAGSIARNRFSLVFSEKTPSIVEDMNDVYVCENGLANIVMDEVSEGFEYSLWKDEELVSELSEGEAQLSASSLESGLTQFTIKAMNSCGSSFDVGKVTVNKVVLIAADALGGTNCGAGQCTLEAKISPDISGFVWYESETSSAVLSNEATFQTPFLEKSKKYYVAAINKAGCEGERIVVNAEIIHVDPVVSQEGFIFKSSYEEGNQWYKDGVLIPGATASEYTPDASGSYTVAVTVKGCRVSSLAREFSVNDTHIEELPNLYAFPNPTVDVLNINTSSQTGYRFVHLTNTDGKIISSISLTSESGRLTGIVDLRGRPAGMYYLKFEGVNRIMVTKAVKL